VRPDSTGAAEDGHAEGSAPRSSGKERREPGEISPWSLAGLGLQLAVSLWIFVTLGQWLDRRLDTAPLFLLSGVLLGAGGTFALSLQRLLAPRTPPRSPDRASSDRSTR
jgi:F0F1-type ATP synthase assembly protein I